MTSTQTHEIGDQCFDTLPTLKPHPIVTFGIYIFLSILLEDDISMCTVAYS